MPTSIASTPTTAPNPLLQLWDGPFGLPPFGEIAPDHFRPAFDEALAEERAEILAIAADAAAPTFVNTVEALERGGQRLRRVSSVFFNLAGANTNDAIQAVELEIAPVLAQHRNAIFQNEALFRRVEDLWRRRDALGLSAEQSRVLERYRTIFQRQGAGLPEPGKRRLGEVAERLASLGAKFGQNVLSDERAYALVLKGPEDLAGLPRSFIQSAAQAAEERGFPGKHAVTLARSSIEPFLQFSTRRDLREAAFKAWANRGEHAGAADNRPIIVEMVALRAERARLLGYPSFAHYRLADSMAKTPDAALELLNRVWAPARVRALRERDALQALVRDEGGNFELAPWDWRHFSERRRKAEFDFDESAVKPYLQLDKVREAAFYVAGRLFGLAFRELRDLSLYHPDVRAWEVTETQGRHVGIFLADDFGRQSKRSGAWMSSFRGQEKLAGDIRPVVVNVMNFAKAGADAPTLLSFDDARTLFHEFGHALHGLLSDVTYPLLAGTNVSRDFVEFPSQLFEHWLERPELLGRFAVHYRTREPMPADLLAKILAARTFNQGFATLEYASSALIDLDLHMLDPSDGFDPATFEQATAERIGMPDAIIMRHRLPHFAHIFSGDGYAAAYYSYLWSEVLDADGFGAFEEAGDIFDPTAAKRLHDFVYSAGFLRDPEEAYRGFRGRMPDPEALLRKRGLADPILAQA